MPFPPHFIFTFKNILVSHQPAPPHILQQNCVHGGRKAGDLLYFEKPLKKIERRFRNLKTPWKSTGDTDLRLAEVQRKKVIEHVAALRKLNLFTKAGFYKALVFIEQSAHT